MKELNEMTPWGLTWGRTSKAHYKKIVENLAAQVEDARQVIYMRDLLYNPCHEANRIIASWKPLNKGIPT